MTAALVVVEAGLAVIGALASIAVLAVAAFVVWSEQDLRRNRLTPPLVCVACHVTPVATIAARCTPCIVAEHLPQRAR